MKAWPGFVIDKEYQRKCDTFDRRLIEGPGKAMRDKIWEDIKK